MAGSDVLLGELGPGVDDDRLDRAGTEGPLTDRLEVAPLADVHGHGHHLEPSSSSSQRHRHRRVETPAVGEHHALRHHRRSVRRCRSASFDSDHARRAARPARPSRRGPRPPPRAPCRLRPPSRPRRRSRQRSSAEPTTWADPGGVRRTTRLAEWATSTTHSPSTRRRWSSGATWCLGSSGTGVDGLTAGTRTFTAPSSSRSRDTVAWVASTPSAASSATSWAWLATALASSRRAIRCWRCGLPSFTPHPARDPDPVRAASPAVPAWRASGWPPGARPGCAVPRARRPRSPRPGGRAGSAGPRPPGRRS